MDSNDRWGGLMRAALQGDEAAYRLLLDELARAFRAAIRSRLARMGQGNAEIEDIVQETLLAIHLKRGTWDASRPFAPWAQAVMSHKLTDRLRRGRSARFEPIDDQLDTLVLPEPDPDAAGDVDRVLSRLEPAQRKLVTALSLEGRSAADVAAETGASEGAIRVALHRALRRLAMLYREERS